MSVKRVCEKKYPMETIIHAFKYFTSSRTAYNHLREDLQLPNLRTLTCLMCKVRALVDDVTSIIFFLTFPIPVKNLHLVVIRVTLQYHGGVVFNKTHLSANTVLSSMLVTLYVGSTFLCKMLPMREPDAKFLAFLLMQLNVLEET